MKKDTVYIPDALPFDTWAFFYIFNLDLNYYSISYEDIVPEDQQFLNVSMKLPREKSVSA